jgi:asparagine synthetase B (glutamine-hydrolysing)
MCGIYVTVSRKAFEAIGDNLKQLLSKRGPDHMGEETSKVETQDGISYFISFTSSVLALRGGQVIAQPFKDPQSGSIFCWNGEAWRLGTEPVVGNDGRIIFGSLLEASSSQLSTAESVAAVLKVLRSISGPFAFVFLDKFHGALYFGRDRLGRRSLLFNTDGLPDSMEFSSSGDLTNGNWKEVDADGIYRLSFTNEQPAAEQSQNTTESILPQHRHIWEVSDSESPVSITGFIRNKVVSTRLP